MKTKWIFLCGLLLIGAACAPVSDQAKSQMREEQKRMVVSGVEGRDFEVEVLRAMPMRGRSIVLSGVYSLRIKGDSVYSHLPYFGRAYSLPYGGGEGLIFEGLMEGYAQRHVKSVVEIEFQVRTNEDRYKIGIDVGYGGTATIRVSPSNKQMISFDGRFTAPESKR